MKELSFQSRIRSNRIIINILYFGIDSGHYLALFQISQNRREWAGTGIHRRIVDTGRGSYSLELHNNLDCNRLDCNHNCDCNHRLQCELLEFMILNLKLLYLIRYSDNIRVRKDKNIMSKLKIEHIDAYRRISNYSRLTYSGYTGVVRLSHNKNEIVYIVPMGEGDYECESHYCNVMSESEFNKEYALERKIK